MNVDAVFSRPFEVTQFWISDRYVGHSAGDDNGRVILQTKSDRPGQWFLKVSLGAGKSFVGDFIPPFLPTRHNIAILNAAVKSMAELAHASDRAGKFVPPKRSPLAGITASSVPVTRNINDERYRKALFEVFAVDWGIVLPHSPSSFGENTIHLRYRPGLPCGPAMVSAVQPILEAAWGALKKVGVATSSDNGMTIDTVTYSGQSFTGRTQAFDITEYFGKPLPDTRFNFCTNGSEEARKEVADPGAMKSIDGSNIDNELLDELGGILRIWKTTLDAGKPVGLMADMIFHAKTQESLGWDHPAYSNPLDFCDFFTFATRGTALTDPEVIVLAHRAKSLSLDIESSDRLSRLRQQFRRKKWWQFWK